MALFWHITPPDFGKRANSTLRKCSNRDVTVGVSLTGALTPAGLGISALIPLIKAGFIDWIVSTGANLYHDTHFGIGLSLHQGSTAISDIVLRDEEVVRIYDIFFDYSVLLDTDAFFRRIIELRSFRSRCLRLNSITSVAGISGNGKKNSVSKINLCWRLPTIGSSDLHLLARRFIYRYECCRESTARK